MSQFDWSAGQLITMSEGDSATCLNLDQHQLYGLFFYNSANNDTDAIVTVSGSDYIRPVPFIVPGTTGNEGLAAICFVSGDDTSTVTVQLNTGQSGSSVQAFIGSVKMPIDTDGINNQSIPLNGQQQPFSKFTRYYTVPESHWYTASVTSNIDTFVCVEFTEDTATIICVNAGDGVDNVVNYYGPSAKSKVNILPTDQKTKSWPMRGNGTQFVWINADSVQNSQQASICIQSNVNQSLEAKRPSNARPTAKAY